MVSPNPELATALDHHRAGRLSEALDAYRQILQRNPDDPDALHLLGNLARQTGKLDIAVDLITRALALRPDTPAIHNSLGVALSTVGKKDQAIAEFRRAIALEPQLADALSNLGVALREKGDPEQAIQFLTRAVQLAPANFSAHNNLGNALLDNARYDDALAAFDRAIQLNSAFAKARWNRGLLRLTLGDFPGGWEDFEWRLQTVNFAAQRNLQWPRWTGQPLAGKSILIRPEQGYGDIFQFIRFIPRLLELGAKPTFDCPPELSRLLQPNFPGCDLLSTGEPTQSLDYQVSLLSLAGLFNTRIDTIPSQAPHLKAHPVLWQKWATQLGARNARLRIGIVWAGRPTHPNERNRSIQLVQFAPLAEIPSVEFVSLQTGEAAAQASTPPPGMRLIDLTPQLKDFADTAALIHNLDLIISVDTAVAHLAGVMGKPTWILLPHVPDWRWLLDRPDTPWYPTATLFRQPRRNDWTTPVNEIAAALTSWATK